MPARDAGKMRFLAENRDLLTQLLKQPYQPPAQYLPPEQLALGQ